jgi:outer membrane protein assembly factor BamB
MKLLALVAAFTCLGASDWPGWRGPNRDGLSTETGLRKSWPAAGPTLAWQTQGLGPGFSLAISGNRIYTMGDRGDGQYVLALNLSDGQQVWSMKIGPAWSEDTGRSGSARNSNGRRIKCVRDRHRRRGRMP